MISISKKSNRLLLKCIKTHKPCLAWIIESNEIINVDEKIGNELRELIGDEFMLRGLDNDIPNEYGLALETLIDELGHLFIH